MDIKSCVVNRHGHACYLLRNLRDAIVHARALTEGSFDDLVLFQEP